MFRNVSVGLVRFFFRSYRPCVFYGKILIVFIYDLAIGPVIRESNEMWARLERNNVIVGKTGT